MDGAFWSRFNVDVEVLAEQLAERAREPWLEGLGRVALGLATRFYGVPDLAALAAHPSAPLEIAAVCEASRDLTWDALLEAADATVPHEELCAVLCEDGRPLASTLALWLYFTKPSLLELAQVLGDRGWSGGREYILSSRVSEKPLLFSMCVDDALSLEDAEQQPPRTSHCVALSRSGDGSTTLLLERTCLATRTSPFHVPSSWIMLEVPHDGRIVRMRTTEREPLLGVLNAVMSAGFGTKVEYGFDASASREADVLAFLQEACFDVGPSRVVRIAYRSLRVPSSPELTCVAPARSYVGEYLVHSEESHAFTPAWLEGLREIDLVGRGCLLRCSVRALGQGLYELAYRCRCATPADAAAFADELAAVYGVHLHAVEGALDEAAT